MSKENYIFWIIFVLIFFLVNCLKIYKNIKHINKIRDARRIYKKINAIENPNEGWLISYLRKIDPYVFEELILYSFKQKGWHIKRNKRYSGDGGIDGRIRKGKEKYIIQAKRYTEYINIEHVKNFIKICRTNKTEGMFIHTGKTGKETKELLKTNPQIKLISGMALYDLFIREKQ